MEILFISRNAKGNIMLRATTMYFRLHGAVAKLPSFFPLGFLLKFRSESITSLLVSLTLLNINCEIIRMETYY